jgi:hypothetical protein
MNLHLAFIVTASLIQPLLAASFTYESSSELSAAFDADGDGHPDLIVVDKTTGVRQLALQQSDGSFLWSDPASTGLESVSSLTAGAFRGPGLADGFAVAGPMANRAAQFPDAFGSALTAPAFGIGPNLVVALDLTGDGLDDLVLATEWDNPPDAAHLAGIQTGAAGLSVLYPPVSEPGPLGQGNRVRLTSDGPWVLAAMQSPPTGPTLVTRFAQSSSGFSDGPALGGLANNTMWAWGEFGAGTNSQFLFYIPGKSVLQVQQVASASAQLSWTPVGLFDLGQAISQVTVLSNPGGDLLLVTFGDGSTAATYDFDGIDAPAVRQTLTAPTGMKFSMAGALGGGDFLLLHGPNGGQGNSSGWQRWNRNGSQHTLASSGTIPPLSAVGAHANVLLYGANPDGPTDAPVLQVLQAGEWSTAANLNGGTLQVTQERSRAGALGLGNPSLITVPTAAASPAGIYPVVNQRSLAESAVLLGPPVPQAFADLTFAPAPGTYHLGASPFRVRFTAAPAAAIFYRTSATQPWSLFDSNAPPAISVTTTFLAYAATSPPTPIRAGTYVIADPPSLAVPPAVDTNQNGLPDSWEQTFGLSDPNGDADGDGFTNLQEYQAGTDPLDPSSKPAVAPNVELIVQAAGPNAPPGTLCEILWPVATVGAILETTTDLSLPATWAPVTNPVVIFGSQHLYFQPNNSQESVRFFRLRLP